MTQHIGGSNWIDAYLEWTDGEIGMSEQLFAVSGVEAGDDWAEETAAVYLEWIDAEPAAMRRAAAILAPEPLREAVLLMALRTESECMHILRQALDAGRPTSQTMQLAMEALDCAKNLLDDERRAWQALSALRLDEPSGARIAWDDETGMDWPCALENVEADVRALSGRILELRAH
jgi:hypothetical protein